MTAALSANAPWPYRGTLMIHICRPLLARLPEELLSSIGEVLPNRNSNIM